MGISYHIEESIKHKRIDEGFEFCDYLWDELLLKVERSTAIFANLLPLLAWNTKLIGAIYGLVIEGDT